MEMEQEVELTVGNNDGEELAGVLSIDRDKFTLERKTIKIEDIMISEPLKGGRRDTLSGLTKSIADLGVLAPIHVMDISRGEAEMYNLLDGARRLYGALRNGVKELDAIVWTFEDRDIGKRLTTTIHMILNRVQLRRWGEIWDLMQTLETQMNITPGSLEYLLMLQAGEAMKLKDVMLCEYSDVKEALLSGDKDLKGAYSMLQKHRKEEDELAIGDAKGITNIAEDGEEIATEEMDNARLSDDDVRELMDMANSDSSDDVGEEDFADMNESVFGDEVQKVGERHIVDQAIKQGTFQRDNFKCRCCGTGGVAFLGALVYHHLIPVHAHGEDSVDNGLTLCDSCHLVLHCAERSGGRIPMEKSQFEEYSEDEQKRIKNILKYAKIAVEAQRRLGMSKEDIAKSGSASARQHRMPGEGLKETQANFARNNH